MKGITTFPNGHFRARAMAGGVRLTKRFKPGTSLRTIREWQHCARLKADRLRITRELATLVEQKGIPKKEDGWCYIYVVECGGRVKLGRSTNVRKRLQDARLSRGGIENDRVELRGVVLRDAGRLRRRLDRVERREGFAGAGGERREIPEPLDHEVDVHLLPPSGRQRLDACLRLGRQAAQHAVE
jgi:hypothetical protein